MSGVLALCAQRMQGVQNAGPGESLLGLIRSCLARGLCMEPP